MNILYCGETSCLENTIHTLCSPVGACLAAGLAGSAKVEHRRADKAAMPPCAPGAHWESEG